jgi:hypothetical protein
MGGREMGDDQNADNAEKTQALAALANSPAAQKLAEAVKNISTFPQNILDHIAGPKRVAHLSKARAEGTIIEAEARAQGALIEAKAQAKIERIRAETAAYVLDREMRKTQNREAIIAEAFKALPPPTTEVPKELPSEDLVYRFFDSFEGVGDPEMQKIAGRLLAGEVTRPGSYSRKTIRTLADLDSSDFLLFQTLCRFVWRIGDWTPLVFDPNAAMYKDQGLSYRKCEVLEALGLARFESLAGRSRMGFPQSFVVSYGRKPVSVELKEGADRIEIGRVAFSPAGSQLVGLTNASTVSGFLEYVAEKWRADGHKVTLPNE